jgi:hypothetical protein
MLRCIRTVTQQILGTTSTGALRNGTGDAPSAKLPFSRQLLWLTHAAVVFGMAFTLPVGGAAATLVQSNAAASNAPGNSSQSVAFITNAAAGNTIFVFVQYYNAAVTATVTDTCGDAFTEIAGAPKSSGTSGTADWFIAKNVVGGACTVTATYSSSTDYGAVAIFEVSGLGGASVAIDQFGTGSGNGTAVSASISPTQANSFAIAQIWSSGGGAYALGGSWTTAESSHFSTLYQGNLAGYQALASTATVSLTTAVGGGPWVAMLANFYIGSSGQAATPTFTPAPGSYTSAVAVTINTATSGASISYTTDGSTPTQTHGTIGVAPVFVTLGSTMTLKAIAFKSGYTDSSPQNGLYTINPVSGPVVQSNAAATDAPGVNSQTAPFPSAVTAGNTLLVFVQYYNGPVPTSVADDCGDTFAEISAAPPQAARRGQQIGIWRRMPKAASAR